LSNLVASLQGRVTELEDVVMEESDDDTEGEAVSLLLLSLDPVENMVVIPIPAPSVVQTLVPIDFVPPSLCSSPSPPYVQDVEDDPLHDGVPEYLVNPEVDL
jgi:hypothetical protein